MRQMLFLGAIVLMAMACPQVADAQQFSGVTPSGHTLQYDTVNGVATVLGFQTGLNGDLVIPDSVTHNGTTYAVETIRDMAFVNCSGLTSVSIPGTVKYIGGMAFKNCTGLTSITIPESVVRIGLIPNGTTYDGTFQGCTGLTEVNFNADSCEFMRYPFIECDSITVLNIGNNVKAIPETAFRNLSAITSLFIPASVVYIAHMAFEGCGGIDTIVVDENNPVYDSRDNCNAIIETATGTLFRGCHNTVIPAAVTIIGHTAFAGCTQITSFAIPETIEVIETGAFRGCTAMTSVDIPSSVVWIYEGAFYHCEALTSVSVPASVTFLGTNAFAHCISMTSAVIPPSITVLNGYTFFMCENLTSVTLPGTLTIINDATFMGCESLPAIDIPDSVTYMGDNIFHSCHSLSSVTLPQGLTHLGKMAFFGCSGLTYIRSLAAEVPETPDTIQMFRFVPTGIPVYVPCGSSIAYDTTWGHFTNYIEETGFSYDIQSADLSKGSVQIQAEPTTCANPALTFIAIAADGYAFDHWSDGSTDNPRTILLTQDTTLLAYFSSSASIENIADDGITVYTRDGRILVEGTQGEKVYVYDMMGRQLSAIDRRLPAGVYMVKVGPRPARKVVVTGR